jgi:hypothetical protein
MNRQRFPPQCLGEPEEGKSGFWWSSAGRGPSGLNGLSVVSTVSGDASGFHSLPHQNQGWVAEETRWRGGGFRESGALEAKTNSYRGREPWEALGLEFREESARGGS